MANYNYRVDLYMSESPTFEGITWSQFGEPVTFGNYQEAKREFDRYSARLYSDSRNIMRISQGRKTEEQAMNSRQSSMRFETWEVYNAKTGRRVWMGIALYVIAAKEKSKTQKFTDKYGEEKQANE